MTTRPDEEKKDVLYEFSVEPIQDVATLDKYLQSYPQYRDELIALSIELSIMPSHDTLPVDGKVANSIDKVWEKFQSIVSPSDPVSRVSNANNPLRALDKQSFRSLANKLGVNTLFLVKLRDRTIKASTIPTSFIEDIAITVGKSIDAMRAALDGSATVSPSATFKADGKPSAEQQMTFDEAIETSNLSEKQKTNLRAIKD